MKRISTATKAVDKFGAGKHGFTNGNAVSGIPATDLEDAWFDHLQEEVAGIVEAAGIVLDSANRAQLLAALRSAGVFQTPAIGDDTTKAATTAFFRAGSLGIVQTWQNVTGSRSWNTTYTNTTGRPICIIVKAVNAVAASLPSLVLTVGGVQVSGFTLNAPGGVGSVEMTVSGIVPPGATYIFTQTQLNAVIVSELR